MNLLKSTLILISALMIAGCTSHPKKNFVYVQVFDTGTSYPKAIAQCQYEEHLQGRADTRANADSGRGLLSIISGMPGNTQILCMKRFGWELQEQVSSIASTVKSSLPNEKEISQSSTVPVTNNRAKQEELNELSKKNNSRCLDSAYQLYFKNSPCSTKSVDPVFFLNEKYISDEESVIAKLVFSENNVFEQRRTILIKDFGTARVKILDDIYYSYKTEFNAIEKQLLSLIITWGQYNRKKIDLTEKMLLQMGTIPK